MVGKNISLRGCHVILRYSYYPSIQLVTELRIYNHGYSWISYVRIWDGRTALTMDEMRRQIHQLKKFLERYENQDVDDGENKTKIGSSSNN